MSLKPVHVVGGGLAGSEAAWQLAQAGVPVVLHEMRPVRATPGHKTDGFAELVCSNSFRSDDSEHNAVGLLHEEMRRLGSLIMCAADANQVPAGGGRAGGRRGVFWEVVGGACQTPEEQELTVATAPSPPPIGTTSSLPPAHSPRPISRARSAI